MKKIITAALIMIMPLPCILMLNMGILYTEFVGIINRSSPDWEKGKKK